MIYKRFKKSEKAAEGQAIYWQSKVVEDQSDIKFKLLNVYIDGDTVVAEWDASFYSNRENGRIHTIEVAILEFEGEKIKSLREYWHSERV